MEEKKGKNSPIESEFIFGNRNYKFMFIGIAVILLGFILMSGGGSDDPAVWSDGIFHWRRIRLAPTLVLIGFGIQIYAILTRPEEAASKK